MPDEVFHRTCCRTHLLLIKDGFFEVVTGNQVGLRHFGERRLGKEFRTTLGRL